MLAVDWSTPLAWLLDRESSCLSRVIVFLSRLLCSLFASPLMLRRLLTVLIRMADTVLRFNSVCASGDLKT